MKFQLRKGKWHVIFRDGHGLQIWRNLDTADRALAEQRALIYAPWLASPAPRDCPPSYSKNSSAESVRRIYRLRRADAEARKLARPAAAAAQAAAAARKGSASMLSADAPPPRPWQTTWNGKSWEDMPGHDEFSQKCNFFFWRRNRPLETDNEAEDAAAEQGRSTRSAYGRIGGLARATQRRAANAAA